MEAVIKRVCGLDVHKDIIVACVRTIDDKGKVRRKVQKFAAHLQGLLELRAWLTEWQVEAIAMEGTGIYWRPLYAVLEVDAPWQLIVGNAQHIKNVPGRKTDVNDAQWLAELVSHGLIRPSFVPPPAIRSLRDVLRMRGAWMADRSRSRNRVGKILQMVGIKLDGVASDLFGKSGMAMLRALCEGTATPAAMAKLAKGTLRNKIDALTLALESPLDDVHRAMLTMALKALDCSDQWIADYDAMIDKLLEPYRAQVDLLVTIPGVDRVAAATIIGELGPDMRVFPTVGQAASWAGLSPGNHESAGKRGNTRTTKGNPYLKTMLCQAAHAAARTKTGYLRDKFYRLKARRGPLRALMAIAHKILVAAYHMLRRLVPYKDLGTDYLDQRDKNRVVAGLVARLESLGMNVSLTPVDTEPPKT